MVSKNNSSKHVLVCGAVHQAGMELLEEATGVTYEVIADDSDELTARIPDADGVTMRICNLDINALEQVSRLQVISRHGVGCDNLPVAELTARGIPVMVTGSANSAAVAEHAIYLMFVLARQGLVMDRAVRANDWQVRSRLATFELAGRQLLIVGCGRIGSLTARKALALDMQVTIYDPFTDAKACTQLGAQYASDLHEALPHADIVSLHLPSVGACIIGARELELLPNHALLINVSRGDLVDETALVAALTTNGLAGAGLDVFGAEPPPANHPLFGLDNVVVTPHCAALTAESLRRMGIVCVQNVLDVFADRIDPTMVFNPGWAK